MKINIKNIIATSVLSFAFPFIVHAEGAKITVARAFYELAHNNSTQKIEILLDRGYSIESVDEQGYNPVCLAVMKQDKSAYRSLVSYGATRKPACLQQVPAEDYKNFFGTSPMQTTMAAAKHTSDVPYLVGATAIGVGAVATAYVLRGSLDKGGGGGDKKTCPNGTFDKEANKCICNEGYYNYGDDMACYAPIIYCKTQEKDQCLECNSGYSLKDNVCYAPIDHCKVQDGNICKECSDNYVLKDNVCYAPINNCKIQDGGICKECNGGYGIHGGDGTYCYVNIDKCRLQKENKCEQCISGYGTHKDASKSTCYKDVEHCMEQYQTACEQCYPGYDTYGNPQRDYCYDHNPCVGLDHTIPVRDGETVTCVCDENKGYFGEPGQCEKADEEESHEGDGNTEEWNNLNAQYCNSHGKYNATSGLCACYTGYAGPTNGCSGCADGYTNFEIEGGLCYKVLDCGAGTHKHQKENICICDDGYLEFEGTCYEQKQCEKHHRQTGPDTCECKENFDETCTVCKEGYTYAEETDECIREKYICDENWTGAECDICPAQFKITYDGGSKHCIECADNRQSREEGNEDCSLCAKGFEKNEIDNTCIITECSMDPPPPGYIYDETTGKCVCDEANGYARSLLGACVKKGEDLIGLKDRNINNSQINLNLDGETGEFRDIYGMKPYIEDEEGNKTYYDEVYNAYSDVENGDKTASISITNKNIGGNVVYGIYSPNTVYNAATYSFNTTGSATSTGKIDIKDENTISNICGLANISSSSIYNAFVRNMADASAYEPSNNRAIAIINIAKDEDSTKEKEENGSGMITGIRGIGNILNAYASTVGGTAANAYASGRIEILHNGVGDVIGIYGMGVNQRMTNAYSYLDSAISDAVSVGTISLTGNNNVYGIFTSGIAVNSESQFNKGFPVVNDFHAEGNINVTTRTDEGAAYGLNVYDGGANTKADIYNAYGYRSTGNITATNLAGGSAYGIWNSVMTYYEVDEDGNIIVDDQGIPIPFYSNTYNAFRSSAKYGGENSDTIGNVNVQVAGSSAARRDVIGMYAAGDVFNSYARSLSNEELRTTGNITITDSSRNPGLTLKGIDSNGATIANAYATGSNLNTTTSVVGNIRINIPASKQGGFASGIYSGQPSATNAVIYNAALINDTSNVEGNIIISGTGSTTSNRMYGMYVSKYDIESGSPSDGQEKTVYNAYYENEDASGGTVKGTINISTTGRSMNGVGEYYGIFVRSGKAYNAYSTKAEAIDNVIGKINVNVAGGEYDGMAVGMHGHSSMLYNTGKSTIDVNVSRQNNKAFGMRAGGDDSYIENDAIINVTSQADKAYGIYIENGQALNDKNGVITVAGNKGSYGIYAKDNGSIEKERKIINRGTIKLISEENNIGIYAEGSNLTVYNEAGGKIYINGDENSTVCEGEDCRNVAIQLVGAKFVNDSEVESNNDLDLTNAGGEIILGSNGKFKAKKSIMGDISVATSTVSNNFDDTTSIKDAISAADISNLNIKSNSFLYNSTLKPNADGSYDVVLERKDFNALTKDRDDTKYLEKNYANKRNMALFNTLKEASTASAAKKTWAEVSGKSVLPNIPEEELKVQRSLDRTIVGELFKEGEDIRKMVGGDAMHIGRSTHDNLTGYDLNSQSMYALYDQKQNNNYRLGLGLSFTHTNTEYNNDSRRKNFMIQGYVPLTYTNGRGLTAVSMARLGYTNGDYKRYGHNKVSYEADTEALTYGLLNEARYSYDLKFLKLTPFIGLNATGWYQQAMSEGNRDLALHIATSQVFSLESALGLYIDKEIEINQDQKLNIALGMGYYHEFADPYKGAEAHHTGSLSHHHLKNTLHSKDRGMLSAKIDYGYKNLSVYGEIIQYLEEENPIEIEGGLQYKF